MNAAVTQAEAVIYSGWPGQFNLSHGPCIVAQTTPTATATASPTVAPTVAPTASPTTQPTATPTVVPTAIPTVAPTVTPTTAPSASPAATSSATPVVSPTPSVSATPRTDLTDGRSDGLGCSVKDCSGNQVPTGVVAGVSTYGTLPTTGNYSVVMYTLMAVVAFVLGVRAKAYASKELKKLIKKA